MAGADTHSAYNIRSVEALLQQGQIIPLLVGPDVWLAIELAVMDDAPEDDRAEEGDGLCDLSDETWTLLGCELGIGVLLPDGIGPADVKADFAALLDGDDGSGCGVLVVSDADSAMILKCVAA